MQARLGGAVQLPGRLVVTHAVDLVVREPELAVLGVEVHSHRVADAAREDLAPGAVEGVQADDAADAHLRVEVELLLRRHVERLAHRDVELGVLGADAAHARAMVERLFLFRDQLALAEDLDDRHVRPLVEELGGGEVQHAVVLHDDEKAVLRPAHAVGHLELERGRERLHLVGVSRAGAVGHRPDGGLARADEHHVRRGRDRHHAGIGHDAVELDLEPGRQLDPLQVFPERIGALPRLGNGRDVEIRPGDFELLQLLEVRRRCLRRHGRCDGQDGHQQCADERVHRHGNPLGCWIVRTARLLEPTRCCVPSLGGA